MTSYWILSFGDYFIFVDEGYLLEHGCLINGHTTAKMTPLPLVANSLSGRATSYILLMIFG